jgi:hypothetical protein
MFLSFLMEFYKFKKLQYYFDLPPLSIYHCKLWCKNSDDIVGFHYTFINGSEI